MTQRFCSEGVGQELVQTLGLVLPRALQLVAHLQTGSGGSEQIGPAVFETSAGREPVHRKHFEQKQKINADSEVRVIETKPAFHPLSG